MLKPQLAIGTQPLLEFERPHWPERLRQLHSLGYRGLGIDRAAIAAGLGSAPAEPPLSDAVIGVLADEAGMAIAWLQADLPIPAESSGAETSDIPELAALAELARSLGTPNLWLRVGRLSEEAGETERARVAWFVQRWKAAARLAAAHGVRALWVLELPSLPLSLSAVETVLRTVDEPNFGLVFDTQVMHQLAHAEGHEHIEEGTPLRGALGMLERFKGDIGGIRLAEPDPGATPDHERLISALVDAWIPDPWWTLDVPRFAEAGPAAESLLLRLAPVLSDAPEPPAGPVPPGPTSNP